MTWHRANLAMMDGATVTRSGDGGPVTLRLMPPFRHYLQAQDPTTGRWSMLPYDYTKRNFDDREATDWEVAA